MTKLDLDNLVKDLEKIDKRCNQIRKKTFQTDSETKEKDDLLKQQDTLMGFDTKGKFELLKVVKVVQKLLEVNNN